jgi:hypothetical protein
MTANAKEVQVNMLLAFSRVGSTVANIVAPFLKVDHPVRKGALRVGMCVLATQGNTPGFFRNRFFVL